MAGGLFRRDGVLGPDRVGSPQAGWPVLVTLLLGTSAWLGVQMGLAAYKQAQWLKAGHTGQFQLTDLSAHDYAFLSTIPGVIAIAAIFVCLRVYPPAVRPKLGVGAREMPSGLAKGVGAVLIILPPVLLISVLTEWLYRRVQFQHPSEHELLHAMRDSGPTVRWMLIAGAVLVAPVIEELLFRGLFQTLLVWAFNMVAPKTRRQAFAAVGPPPADPPLEAPEPGRLALGRWLAILVTATVFAGIHARWSAPPIFVLAIGLGFAYERTGNLWVTIAVHALFNGFQTAFFLMQSPAGHAAGSS